MEDILDFEKELEEFSHSVKRVEAKEYHSFEDFENAYCDAINKGTLLRNYIINNPSVCDENSLKVLKNESSDFSLLGEKFKCLYSVITLTQKLLVKYRDYVKDRVEKKDYKMAIRIYNQLFKFTHNYFFIIDIANLYVNNMNDIDTSIYLYKNTEPHLSDSYQFMWQFAQIYEKKQDFYNSLLYMQKALKLELQAIDSQKGAENV